MRAAHHSVHHFVDDVDIVAARDVVRAARVIEQIFSADQSRPPPEHIVADCRHDDPAVARSINVARRGVISRVALSLAPMPVAARSANSGVMNVTPVASSDTSIKAASPGLLRS